MTPSRAAAGVIAAVAWLGLGTQFAASLPQVGTILGTVWVLLRYFTVIANLIVAVVFSGAALGIAGLSSPRKLAGVTVLILLVGVVYVLLLRGLLELSGGARLADLLNHTVTPLLVPLYWLVFVPKGALRPRDPWLWAIIPTAYMAYAIARGLLGDVYAYPFMDVPAVGWARLAGTLLVMAAGFLATGFAVLWADRRLASGSRG